MSSNSIDIILNGFYQSNFFTNDLLTFTHAYFNKKPVSQDLIDRLLIQEKKGVTQHDMPFVFCDLLGATQKMKDFEIIDVYHEIYSHLERATKNIRRFKMESEIIKNAQIKFKKNYARTFKINTFMFSDSIILYPDVIGTDLELFYFYERDQYIKTVISFMLVALLDIFCHLTFHGLMLRGVIGYGDVLVQQNPPIYISKIIENMMYLEKNQEWSGILLAPSVIEIIRKNGIEDESLLIEYDVPLKEKQKSSILELYNQILSQPYVLDWRATCTYNEEKLIEKAKDTNGHIRQSVLDKIHNTTNFFNQIKPV